MTASDYRRIAREKLSGNWLISALTVFIAGLLGGALQGSGGGFNFTFNSGEESTISIQGNALPQEALQIIFAILGILIPVLIFYVALSLLVGGTVRLGHAQYLLDQQDGRPLNVATLFSQFGQFKNGFILVLLTGLYIFLWSLLLIIPGIIASYSYAMAPFIQAEHPEYTASESIKASKQMMNGHKWELFCLDLSFIGWALLCTFTLGIGNLFLSAYTSAAYAAFYRKLCPMKLITDTADPVLNEPFTQE